MTGTTATFEVRRYDGEAARHAHDHHQIVLPLAGCMEIEVEGQGGAVSARAAAMIAAGRSHAFTAAAANSFLVADLAAPVGSDPHGRLWDAFAADPFLALDAGLARLTGFLAAESRRFELDSLQAGLAGDLLLGAVARRLELPGAPDPVLRAAAMIKARFAEPITTVEVARAAGLSVSRLHAGFREAFATTPGQLLADCRLRAAARLLTDSGLAIAQIALDVGYGDQSSLTRAFRRRLAMTPAAYRRESRHKDREDRSRRRRGGPLG